MSNQQPPELIRLLLEREARIAELEAKLAAEREGWEARFRQGAAEVQLLRDVLTAIVDHDGDNSLWYFHEEQWHMASEALGRPSRRSAM